MKSIPLFDPVRKSGAFTALWSGQSLSRLGDNILFVVLPMVVYSTTGSTLAMGFLMTLLTIPQVILLPFAGFLADRAPRVPVMIGTDLVRLLLLMGLMVFAATERLSLEVLYGFAVVYGLADGLFQPAYAAIRAEVFVPEIRNAANSLNQITEQISRLIGPALGGLIFSLTSVAAAFGLDSLTFAISILSLLFLLKLETPRGVKNNTAGLRFFLAELGGGFRELTKHTWLWVSTLAFAFINIAAAGMMSILLPWLVKVKLGLPAYQYGILTSAVGLGSLLMGVIFGSRPRWRHRGILAYGGIALQGVTLLGTAFISWFPGLVILMAVSGAGMMLFGLIWEGSLQELVPTEAYGRVASLDMFGSWGLLPLGYLVTGWLAQLIGGNLTILIEGAMMVIIAGIVLGVPAVRKLD